MLRSAIAGNIELIKSKIAESSKMVTLADIKLILKDVKEAIENINQMIRTNNDAYNTKIKLISYLRESLFRHMAYVLQRDFKTMTPAEKYLPMP